MKKNYIAPYAQIIVVETSNMIAATTLNVNPNATKANNTSALGNEGSMWGDTWGDDYDEEE